MKTQITLALALAFGTTTAFADTHAEKMKKAPDAPKDAKKAPDMKKEAPKTMEMPKPDAQIAEMAKSMAGTWKCAGKVMDPANPAAMIDGKATITHKLANDLDKWWIQSNLSAPMGKMTYKFVSYTTFNPLEKKWMQFTVDNMGGAEWSASAGIKDNKLVWEGDSVGQMAMGPSHKAKVRHTHDMTEPKNVKLKGEMSMDGKTWMVGYDVACKK